MRVLICGDRRWTNSELIHARLAALKEEHGNCLLVITGGANGADTIADQEAKKLGIDRVVFPANWEGRGLRAGFVRNELMLRMGKPDLVIGYHRFLRNSKGTKMMLDLGKTRGVPVEHHTGEVVNV